MLHLYRIYSLHPVIHENLRPEKPPKPFPRVSVDEDGRVPPRRKTKTKGKGKEVDGDVAGTSVRWRVVIYLLIRRPRADALQNGLAHELEAADDAELPDAVVAVSSNGSGKAKSKSKSGVRASKGQKGPRTSSE